MQVFKLKKEISLSILFYIESIILIQYATEFGLRLFSCGCKAKFHGFKGRIRFMRQFFPLLGKFFQGLIFVVMLVKNFRLVVDGFIAVSLNLIRNPYLESLTLISDPNP